MVHGRAIHLNNRDQPTWNTIRVSLPTIPCMFYHFFCILTLHAHDFLIDHRSVRQPNAEQPTKILKTFPLCSFFSIEMNSSGSVEKSVTHLISAIRITTSSQCKSMTPIFLSVLFFAPNLFSDDRKSELGIFCFSIMHLFHHTHNSNTNR